MDHLLSREKDTFETTVTRNEIPISFDEVLFGFERPKSFSNKD